MNEPRIFVYMVLFYYSEKKSFPECLSICVYGASKRLTGEMWEMHSTSAIWLVILTGSVFL